MCKSIKKEEVEVELNGAKTEKIILEVEVMKLLANSALLPVINSKLIDWWNTSPTNRLHLPASCVLERDKKNTNFYSILTFPSLSSAQECFLRVLSSRLVKISRKRNLIKNISYSFICSTWQENQIFINIMTPNVLAHQVPIGKQLSFV